MSAAAATIRSPDNWRIVLKTTHRTSKALLRDTVHESVGHDAILH